MKNELIRDRNPLADVIGEHLDGSDRGIYAICSINRLVLEASMQQALEDESLLLVESTSNQVDQFGGYSGMTPAGFVQYIHGVAEKCGFPAERLILGGDHLGPNSWRGLGGCEAMAKACDLMEACVRAGYTKLHLDASMVCTGDRVDQYGGLPEETVAERTAILCEAAERAAVPGTGNRLYVVGTEVPPPGGATGADEGIHVSLPQDVERGLQLTRDQFKLRSLDEAWERVIAVVVQPGVEFGHDSVFKYDREKAAVLSAMISRDRGLVFEAHSTDYQTPGSLKEMVEDHFAILKVGPWLTFAMREALFALAAIEEELLGGRKSAELSRLPEKMEAVMLANPVYWEKYYLGDDEERRLARIYSYSDRSRYYWPQEELQKSLQRLFENLDREGIPLTLLSQHLAAQYHGVRAGRLQPECASLVADKIREVTAAYAYACGLRTSPLPGVYT